MTYSTRGLKTHSKQAIVLLFLFSFSLLPCRSQSKEDSLLFKNKKLTVYYNTKAVCDGNEVYNAHKDIEKLQQSTDTLECPLSYEYYYNPLSLIGDYYSYEAGESGVMACGNPSNYLTVKTINLKSMEHAKLNDLFTEESIVEALKNDKWVMGLVEKSLLDPINTFSEMVSLIRKYDIDFTEYSFAVLNYDQQTGLASVRFVAPEYMGYNHYKHLQLGLLVKPKPETSKLLEAKSNFYLNTFKNGLMKK